MSNRKTTPKLRRAARIDALEPRRMMATFTGTNDFTDVFEVAIGHDSVRVTLNSGQEQVTSDTSIVLDGLFDAQGNHFNFSELPGGTRTTPLSILVKGTGGDNLVSFGSETTGINLERVNTVLTADFDAGAVINIHDNDDPTVPGPFISHTLSSPSRQVVVKGSFQAHFPQRSLWVVNVRVHGGPGNDVFAVAGQGSNTSLRAFGNGGDDTMHTINYGPNNHDNDLDQIFAPDFFTIFDGGEGNDYLDLDDSADQTGDGDSRYALVNGFFSKSGTASFNSVGLDAVEQVFIGADADANDIVVYGNEEVLVTVAAGAGNDTISNHNSSADTLSDFAAGGAFIGGTGTDSIELFDTDGASSATYTFNATTFAVGAQTFEYDATIESFLLEQNDFSSLNVLNAKPSSMALTINAYGGTDTFRVGGGDLDSRGWRLTTLVGGGGIDPIEFLDENDADTAGETESYNFDLFTLTKGTAAGIHYSAFDSQVLKVANGAAGINVPTVNLNTLSGQIATTTIDGGAVRTCTVNVGSGDLGTVNGNLSLLLEGGTINFNDQNATTARDYNLSATGMTAPAPVTFSGATLVNVNGCGQDDDFTITGAAAPTVFNGSIGDDFITIGGGFANYTAAVTVNGHVGEDIVRFSGAVETGFMTGTLRNTSFQTNGLSHSYATCETVVVTSGSGGSDITIQSIPQLTFPAISQTAFTGGSGDDVVRFATGNAQSALDGNVQVNGNGGSDTLIINDSGNATARDYTFDQGNRFYIGTTTQVSILQFFDRTILEGSNGRNTVTVNNFSNGLTIRSNGGNDTINALRALGAVTVNTGPETASASAPFGDSIAVDTDGGATATVLVDESDSVLGLTVAPSGTLRIGQGGVLEKLVGTGSTFSLTGNLDMAGGALLSRAGGPTPAAFRGQIVAGRNGGAWNGTSASGAINSSLAAFSPGSDGVGYGQGSEIAPTTLGGFAIAAGDTLLRYALDGDADLSASVDIADFSRSAANFNGANKVWTTGDSNYDNTTNIADFSPLAANFNQSIAAALVRSGHALPAGSVFAGRLIAMLDDQSR